MRSERVLQRQRVDDGCEHPHVVGRRAVHAGLFVRLAAPDVSAADDDRDGDSGAPHVRDLLGHGVRRVRRRRRVPFPAKASPEIFRSTRRIAGRPTLTHQERIAQSGAREFSRRALRPTGGSTRRRSSSRL